MLLYDRWKEIVAARPSESALTSIRSGQEWTFAELDAWAESFEPSADSALTRVGEREVSTADGFSVELIALTLRAWRRDELLCPVDGMAPDGELFRGIPEAICHVKVTSGSTGKPRLILFRPEQLAADADNIVSTMGLRPDWPNLGIISMAHSYGFSNLVLPLLLHGIPLIWCGDALPGAVATCTQCTKVEKLTLPAVPAMWRTWQQAGILSDRIRLAISAGAPLPLELEQEIHAAHGIKVHNFYGASECGGIAYDRTETPRGSAERAGTAMDNVKLSLTDDGCLEVRGSAVGECYWPDEGESGSVTLRDGSFVSSVPASCDKRRS